MVVVVIVVVVVVVVVVVFRKLIGITSSLVKTGLHYCIYVALSGYDKLGHLILSSFSCLSHYRCCLTLAGIGLVRNIGGVFRKYFMLLADADGYVWDGIPKHR